MKVVSLECDCAETLALALGAWVPSEETASAYALEAFLECRWCGARTIDPELAEVSRSVLS
jgi:hypothetical protein